MTDAARTKTVAQSHIDIRSLMRPHHANFSGNVHGGVVLGLMDEAAYLCASRYSESYCVTAALEHVEFTAPVQVGDMLSIQAAVNAVGRSSMQVGLLVIAEDPKQPGSARRTNRSFFTMVAKGEDGRSIEVPRLVCETDDDQLARCEAMLRLELRGKFEAEVEEGRCRFAVEEGMPSRKG